MSLSGSEEITPGQEHIYGDAVLARISYLEFLDESTPEELEAWEDEIEELANLRALEEQVPGLDGNPLLIEESAFRAWADQQADEQFGLDKTGASAYFKYDEWAEDKRGEQTVITYGGCTYYWEGE